MKLGIISSMAGSPWGGSEELWIALAQEALREGHKVSVSVYAWGETPPKIQQLKKEGAEIHFRSRISYSEIAGKIKGKLTQILFATKQLEQFVKAEKPDLLFISMGALCDLEIDSLRNFLDTTQIPFYIVVHVNTETYVANNAKLLQIHAVCKKAKKIFFVSQRLLQQAERQLVYDFKNAGIVVNPVNMQETGILPFPDSSILQMACVGRIHVDIKGQSLLLQILSSEKWKSRNWHLNIYGKGHDEDLLKQLIQFYSLQDKVFLRGYINDIRKDIWEKNHILLMPSYIEGLPLSLVETMLCGRTAVVTDVGGNREILEDEVSGFIAEGATPFSFEKALEKAWSNQLNWQKMGEAAYAKASSYYGKKPIAMLLENLIE